MSEPKTPRKNWESTVDKQIREAMEQGEFDHLRGAGKPLDLGENPYAPEDWRLAFKVLKDAGFAPEWIEQGKEIRNEMRALATLLDSQSRWQRERRSKLALLAPDKMIAEHEQLEASMEKTSGIYRKRAAALNKTIDTFNLKVPDPSLQVLRLKIDEEIERFQKACR